MNASQIKQAHYSIQVSNDERFKGHLVLVNQQHPVRKKAEQLITVDAFPSIKQIDKGMKLEKTCLEQLHLLLQACGGIDDIVAVSGYRTKKEQTQIYNDSLIERGAAYTSKYVAWPGHSEHQTGLAIDVGRLKSTLDFIAPAFPDTGIYKSFRQHAADYGFIVRYKREKQSITRIAYEPWHFRYVGHPHAKLMEQHDLCLEEYIDLVQHYRYDGEQLTLQEKHAATSIYYVPAEEGSHTEIPILPNDVYNVSGNNRDGFIVTVMTKHQEQLPGARGNMR